MSIEISSDDTFFQGIVVRMCTGDSLLTAKNIAKVLGVDTCTLFLILYPQECGILTMEGTAMEGPMFRRLSPEVLYQNLHTNEFNLFAI